MANNLELQGGIYHVRLAIPKDVQHAFGGQKILSRSLLTGSHKEALDNRLPILATWKQRIKTARTGTPPPKGWQEKTSSALKEMKEFSRQRMLAALGESVPATPVSNQDVEDLKNSHPQWVELAEALTDDDTVERLGGPVGVQRRMYEAFSSYLVNNFQRRYALSDNEKFELNEIFENPDEVKRYCPITVERLAEFKRFREKRNIADKTVDQQQSKLEKLATFLKNSNRPLDFDSVSDWLGSMPLSSKTLAQYILAGSLFWDWVCKYDANWKKQFANYKNPFEKHDLPRTKGKERSEKMRRAFLPSDLKNIFETAKTDNLDSVTTLMKLGIYTGARIEELCQLRKEDIILTEGISSFDIKDSKTMAGIRQVPVHPEIKKLVDELINGSSDGYLIPSASKNKYGIRSDALSKAFGRVKKKCGFGPQYVFHSIRKTFITQLHRGGVPGPIIAELVGHETGTVTYDVYSHGASALQKLNALTKMQIPL